MNITLAKLRLGTDTELSFNEQKKVPVLSKSVRLTATTTPVGQGIQYHNCDSSQIICYVGVLSRVVGNSVLKGKLENVKDSNNCNPWCLNPRIYYGMNLPRIDFAELHTAGLTR